MFGLSPFTLRLPALLGAIGYLVAAAFFARLLAPTSPLRAGLIFIALGLNPWIFDYLPAARGYSMALAGEMTAIFLLSRLVFLSPGQGDERRTHLFASAAAGLGVAANYAFLFAFISLFIAYLVWLFRSTRASRRDPRRLAARLARGAYPGHHMRGQRCALVGEWIEWRRRYPLLGGHR